MVLWDMFSGKIQRIVRFTEVIEVVGNDEEFGMWVVRKGIVSFISINGVELAGMRFEGEVRCLAAFQLEKGEIERVAVCGMGDGGVWMLMPLFEMKLIDCVKLGSPHLAAIEKVAIHPSGKSFVTVDADEIGYRWTVPGMRGGELKSGIFEGCAICGERPVMNCVSCTRGLCRGCGMSGDGRCGLCCGFDVY
jgi:hypothetical protein